MCANLDVPVFAVHLLASGRWEVIAPVARDLAYRYGLRRIAVLDGRHRGVSDRRSRTRSGNQAFAGRQRPGWLRLRLVA
jgi:hypothetical protein